MTRKRIWRADSVVLPDGQRPAAIAAEDGVIVAILDRDAVWQADEDISLAPSEVLLPGLIDIHVHVNEPGRTEWEGFETATRAAAAGGFTTLIDMPLNSSPCTTSLEALNIKKEAAQGKLSMDVGFWGGVVPGNLDELRPMWEAGVFGFKCFLGDSGLDEYPYIDRETLLAAMKEIASFDGLIIIHAEDAEILNVAPGCEGRSYEAFMNSHPAEAEDASIRAVIEAVRETGCRAHILHLGSSSALETIAQAKKEGLPLTVETTPHYLTFDAEEIPDGATEYKCCPPLRGHANRMGLWEGLKAGIIDLVASDHSPSTADLKSLDTGDFGTAWGGISSVQLGFSAVWTQARQLGCSLEDVVRWQGANPATTVGLGARGSIVEGGPADFAVVDPEATFVVDKHELHHKNPVSPYHGRELYGVVTSTWLSGERIDLNGPGTGREISRNRP
ncbi:MAG: allantoinase AllB [Actinomycetaceae bacterium]|nr:allantoinase AllB [Actinomycetaceae bacterium]